MKPTIGNKKLVITVILFCILCGILIYMVFSNRQVSDNKLTPAIEGFSFDNKLNPAIEGFSFDNKLNPAIEGFSFVDKPKPTKLGERRRENFLADEIKSFAFDKPGRIKENMIDSPLRRLKNQNTSSKNNKNSNKLNSFAKKGHVDEFKNVTDELDSLDVTKISIKGISDTVRRYNDNFDNRLKYAREKNNSNDLESAMSQFDVLKDEFVKIFAFSDYI